MLIFRKDLDNVHRRSRPTTCTTFLIPRIDHMCAFIYLFLNVGSANNVVISQKVDNYRQESMELFRFLGRSLPDDAHILA